MKIHLIAALAGLMTAGGALAQEDMVQLADQPGRDVVEGNCGACHSLDYIPMNSPFLDEKGWTGEVNKMVNTFGAPIEAADQAQIIAYLAANYGK